MTEKTDREAILDAAEAASLHFRCGVVTGDLARYETLRAAATPWRMAGLDQDLRRAHVAARHCTAPAGRKRLPGIAAAKARIPDRAAFEADGRAALLFLHCDDGHAREAAVRAFPVAVTDPAAATALLLRCNDWVAQVRDAAFEKLAAVLDRADADFLAPLVLFVMLRAAEWRRGGAHAAELAMAHPDWNEAQHRLFLTATTGPLARALRLALRTPAHDARLPDLALNARSSFVRAVATETLFDARCRWPVGKELQFVPNTARMQRRVIKWESRDLSVRPETLDRVMRAAAVDKAVSVRKRAADHLIRTGPDRHPDLAERLRRDRAGAVAERMNFFERKWAKAAFETD